VTKFRRLAKYRLALIGYPYQSTLHLLAARLHTAHADVLKAASSHASAQEEPYMKNSVKNLATLSGIVLIVGFVLAMRFVATDSVTATAAYCGHGEQAQNSTFGRKCSVCHGDDGAGTTNVGKSLNIVNLRSGEVQERSDTELGNAIANGKNNMPPFKGDLSQAQIKGLVGYIRTLGKGKTS
jgi:mono/diheme cytochrome c family protein